MEFPGHRITELGANIIAESMYAQCHVGSNEYLLLISVVNHRKEDSVVSEEDQRVIIKQQETFRK